MICAAVSDASRCWLALMELYVVLHACVIVTSLDFHQKVAMLIILVIGWRLKFCNYLFIVICWLRYSSLLFCQIHG